MTDQDVQKMQNMYMIKLMQKKSTDKLKYIIPIALGIALLIGYIIYKLMTGNKEEGDPCNKNKECKNKTCARPSSGTDEMWCCPSGRRVVHAFNDYCTEMPNGESCWTNVMCKSLYCKGNTGGLTQGVCTEKLEVGEQCLKNSDCKNKSCARPQAGTDKMVCCSSNRSVIYALNDYCADMDDGTLCWSDRMCQSRNCKGNAGGTKKGICSPVFEDTAPCEANSDCISKTCARNEAGSDRMWCCPSKQSVTYMFNDYCTETPDGKQCWLDKMCSSGFCKGNVLGTKKGVCSPKLEPGGTCKNNSDCIERACAKESASADQKTCCLSGQLVSHWQSASDYCTDLENGTSCYLDAMCLSGHCKGNASGFKKGVCQTK